MALESLFETAFARGCGISRSYALRSSRYRELIDTVPHVPHTRTHEAAEMMYLGERLADRAFQNLPKSIRDRAERWQEMTELQQHQLLNALMTKLTSKRWKHNDKRNEATYNTVSSALPDECGSWSRGKVQPNCLGMSQMLIGFARATGADHLMVDTIVQHDQFTEQLHYLAVARMLKKLKRYQSDPGIAQIMRKLDRRRLDGLDVLAGMQQRHQAHHALAIKVGNDWVVVDPYLGTKYHLDAVKRTRSDIHKLVIAHPRRRHMLIGGRQLKTDTSMAYVAFAHALNAYAKRNQPLKRYDGMRGIWRVGEAYAWIGVDLRTQTLSDQQLESGWVETLLHTALTKQQRKEWMDRRGRPKTFALGELTYRIKHSKRARNAMLKRLVRFACLLNLDTVYSASRSRKAEHRSIELCHPTFHLAVMTLNHIAGYTKQPAADLIRFDSSQWIVHDTLEEVAASGSAQLQRIAETSLTRMRKYPYMMLPGLLAHLELRKEDVHGQEIQAVAQDAGSSR